MHAFIPSHTHLAPKVTKQLHLRPGKGVETQPVPPELLGSPRGGTPGNVCHTWKFTSCDHGRGSIYNKLWQNTKVTLPKDGVPGQSQW
jgi:hypothetical protein